jgi:sugar-specific transcriptional regulator TrmB
LIPKPIHNDMEFVIDQLKLLDLNDREIKVFVSLVTFGQMNMSDLSRKANLSRSTVQAVVERLSEQGIVEARQVKKHKEYMVNVRQITRKLSDLTLNLSPRRKLEISESVLQKSIQTSSTVSCTGLRILSGMTEIYSLYQELLECAKTERICAVQGYESAKRALTDTPRNFLFEVHRVQKKREHILEGIVSESALSLFDSCDIPTLESHLGRLTIIYTVPEEYLLSDMDIVISGKFVAIYSFENENGMKITDKNILRGMKDMYTLLTQSGKRIDLNEYIRGVIEKKQRS